MMPPSPTTSHSFRDIGKGFDGQVGGRGAVETGKIVNRCSGTSLTLQGVGLDWQWIKINGVVAIFDLLAASQVGEAEPLPAKKHFVGIWALGLAEGDG